MRTMATRSKSRTFASENYSGIHDLFVGVGEEVGGLISHDRNDCTGKEYENDFTDNSIQMEEDTDDAMNKATALWADTLTVLIGNDQNRVRSRIKFRLPSDVDSLRTMLSSAASIDKNLTKDELKIIVSNASWPWQVRVLAGKHVLWNW